MTPKIKPGLGCQENPVGSGMSLTGKKLKSKDWT